MHLSTLNNKQLLDEVEQNIVICHQWRAISYLPMPSAYSIAFLVFFVCFHCFFLPSKLMPSHFLTAQGSEPFLLKQRYCALADYYLQENSFAT
jgi:predicted membrane chloride channel (bestrophin family)